MKNIDKNRLKESVKRLQPYFKVVKNKVILERPNDFDNLLFKLDSYFLNLGFQSKTIKLSKTGRILWTK